MRMGDGTTDRRQEPSGAGIGASGCARAEPDLRVNGLSCRLSSSRSFALWGERSPALLGEARGDRGLVSESEPGPRKIQGHGGHRGPERKGFSGSSSGTLPFLSVSVFSVSSVVRKQGALIGQAESVGEQRR